MEAENWVPILTSETSKSACRNVALAIDAHGRALLSFFGGAPRFELTKKKGCSFGFA